MREQRAFKQLEKGLLALTEGDWGAAEKALEKSASKQGRTTAHYLAAAQAADSQSRSAGVSMSMLKAGRCNSMLCTPAACPASR